MATIIVVEGSFYILTNNMAPHYRVIGSTGSASPNWKTFVDERQDTVIEQAHLIGHRLILMTLQNAESGLEIWDLNGNMQARISLPPHGFVSSIAGSQSGMEFYFQYESFASPPAVYKASLPDGHISMWKSSDFKRARPWEVRRVIYSSKDGTQVPMLLIGRSRSLRRKAAPCLMQVYGGFNTPMLPRYIEGLIPWLEDGGIVAVPHLRGGGEYGESWHQAGMGVRKQNTFDDTVAAAEFLIQQGYTSPRQLAIQGGSNGGLTVAAAITQRPELFRAAIMKNPLTDMLRYPLFGQGKAWISEYGSSDNPAERSVLEAYSPYHHVISSETYPSLLILAGDHDDRVDPMHSRKFAAAIAASRTLRPVIFRLLSQSGHSSGGRRQGVVDEWTDRLTFLKRELQVD